MKLVSTRKIRPDSNQPRRTFNEEKMEALEASMRDQGFRKQYPVIVNGENIIVDGERRWLAAKKVGIKRVPVEIKKDVTPAQRLLYQLQSEGAELEFTERNKAWAKLWKLAKDFETKKSLSEKLGTPESTFRVVLTGYDSYQEGLSKLKNKASVTDVSYETMTEIGKEDKKLVEKAVKEKWTLHKTREIKRAIKEKPLRSKQILSQDYSDPYEDSQQWKTRLEVAKSDIDIKELEEMKVSRDKMFKQVDKWDQLMRSIVSMRVAIDEFDYKLAPPEIRVKLHRTVRGVIPLLNEYIDELENYMKGRGELKSTLKRLT